MRTLKILICASAALLAGCFKDVSMETRLVIRPQVQFTADDRSPSPVEGAGAYAFNVDTAQWGVASYEDAAAGVVTHKETGEKLSEPAAASEPYVPSQPEGGEQTAPAGDDPALQPSFTGWIQLQIAQPVQMVVVYDPAEKMYAYTNQKLGENLPVLYSSVIFQPWKEMASYANGGWSFYRDGYVPDSKIDCLIEPYAVMNEGGEREPVASMKIYAYAVDTVEWGIRSYDDAAAGIITRKKGEGTRTSPDFKAYREGESNTYRMEVSKPVIMVVAVDRTHRIYAYTRREVDLKGESPRLSPVFPVWKEMWRYNDDGWNFTNEKYSKQEETPKTADR